MAKILAKGGYTSVFALLLQVLFSPLSQAKTEQRPKVLVAVSANFVAPFVALQSALENFCDCTIQISSGPSGVLATQWANGAPFDVFLSADSAKPQTLYQQGMTAGAPVTYAMGKLLLVDKHRKTLALSDLAKPVNPDQPWRMAIANRNTAPYGYAAEQVLAQLSHSQSTDIVRGNSVLQTLQFFVSGNVDQAIIARSLLTKVESAGDFAWLPIPEEWHDPIVQQGVVNNRADVKTAGPILSFFQQPRVQSALTKWGYKEFSGENE